MGDVVSQSVGQQLKWGLQLGAGICLLGAGVAACAVPMIEFSPHHLSLDQEGVRATAKVTQKEMVRGYQSLPHMRGIGGVAGSAVAGYRLGRALEAHQSGKQIAGPQDSFAIEYRYKPANGEALFGIQGVSRDTYDALRVGSEVKVVYHPANPSIHRLPEYTIPFENSSLLQRILIAFVGFLLGGFTLYRGVMNAMGRKSEEHADPLLDRFPPPASRTATGVPGRSTVKPSPASRRTQQFGARVGTRPSS